MADGDLDELHACDSISRGLDGPIADLERAYHEAEQGADKAGRPPEDG